MTSFPHHFRIANSNSIAHFVEPSFRFFTNIHSDRRKHASGETSHTEILEEQALWIDGSTHLYMTIGELISMGDVTQVDL